MVRRKPLPYLPVLDDIAVLMGPGEGVIIVYAPDHLAGREIMIQWGGRELSTMIAYRSLKGRPFTCALFGGKKPGTYRIWCPSARLRATVRVEAGTVTRVDWRRQA
jgi:hypothetical protein